MAKWERTSFPGVYYRPHKTRKNGVQADKYFAITYRLKGKQKWEALGWASQGIKASRCAVILAELKENQRTGEGPRTLAERRELAEEGAVAREKAKELAAKKALTFAEFWERHYWPLQKHKAEGSKAAESALYAKWIRPAVGDTQLCKLSPIDIERIKSKMLHAKRAASTIKYAFAVIAQVWNLGCRDGYATGESPTRQVRLPKIDNRRDRFLTPEEAQGLLEALRTRSPHSHDMAIFALYAGLRFSEIAALTWRDVDLENETLTIRDPKARVNRQAYITKQMAKVLRKRAATTKNALVFPDANGNPRPRISHTFRNIANELFNTGVTDSRQRVCFHTLRHSFASWLVANGTALYAVKELMGHADFKMTQRYSHLAPEGLRQAAKSIENTIHAKDRGTVARFPGKRPLSFEG